MRIVSSVWLGMAILMSGCIAAVVTHDVLASHLEGFLERVDRSIVPGVGAAQESVLAFNQMMVECEDGVITGDAAMLSRGLAREEAVEGPLRTIGSLMDIDAGHRADALQMAGRLGRFRDDAAAVFPIVSRAPAAPGIAEKAAELARRASDLRRDLANLEQSLEQDLHQAIHAQDRRLSMSRWIGNAALGAMLTVVLAGTIVLTLRWSARLRQLMDVSQRLAHGDLDVDIKVAGNDEVGQLGSQFEHMRRAISDRDLSLRVFNDTLEHQVQERTEEVEKRNRELTHEVEVRQRAEANLRAAHQEAESMLGSLGSGLIGLDADDRITRWNGASERMFGLSAENVIGRMLSETGIRCDWSEVIIAVTQCAASNGIVNIDALRYENGHDEQRWMSLIVSPSRMQESSRPGRGFVILLVTDITDRRHAEIQRTQSAKLESIGQLAAGIAHEINTPIQFIGDNLRFLSDAHAALGALRDDHRKALDDLSHLIPASAMIAWNERESVADTAYLDAEVPKAISQSLEGVSQVATIVQAMKTFSHPDARHKTPLQINSAVLTAIGVARSEYKYVADVVTHLDADLPTIPCYPSAIHQVLLNLIVNAAHAIGDVVARTNSRGTITIVTRRDDRHVIVSISDTGTGIPDACRPKIFTPFFTTKGIGKGTGQGLHLAYTTIVKQHDGQITFDTAVGQGTTFVITLPL